MEEESDTKEKGQILEKNNKTNTDDIQKNFVIRIMDIFFGKTLLFLKLIIIILILIIIVSFIPNKSGLDNQNPPAGCNNLWWYDNEHSVCQQPKQFCAAYMYFGLQTFETKEACENALAETK